MNYQYLTTPVGRLRLLSSGSELVRIEFEGREIRTADQHEASDPVLVDCAAQLSEYFQGTRRVFHLPLGAAGTDFQQRVWQALGTIPYGQVRSYGDLARAIGNASAVRAVGAANGRNPLPIVVPCHRVIGSDGRLTGFAGGLGIKEALLRLEGAWP